MALPGGAVDATAKPQQHQWVGAPGKVTQRQQQQQQKQFPTICTMLFFFSCRAREKTSLVICTERIKATFRRAMGHQSFDVARGYSGKVGSVKAPVSERAGTGFVCCRLLLLVGPRGGVLRRKRLGRRGSCGGGDAD